MKSFPKQLLLDFEYAGEISVGKEKKKNTESENEDRGKGDKSREKRAVDGLQHRL